MNEKNVRLMLEKMLAEYIPPASINLWPAIEGNLVNKNRVIRNSVTINWLNADSISFKKRRWAAIMGLLTILLGIFMVATPQGKAFAQSVLNFFRKSEQNVREIPGANSDLVASEPQAPILAPSTAGKTSACGSLINPTCSLEKVKGKIGFPILAPAITPKGSRFSGAFPLADGVLLKYEGEMGIILLAETIANPQNMDLWEVGRDASIEYVTVSQQPAEYVQGAWAGLGLKNQGVIPWDRNVPTGVLRWLNDGILFTLVNFPMATAQGPAGLDMAEYIAFAESLKPLSDNGKEDAASTGLTLEQAEDTAGFDFEQPGWLPGGFNLTHTQYNSQHNAICQYFQYGQSAGLPSMVIAQSGWALPEIGEIQAKAEYDGNEVVIARTEAMIQIAGASGGKGRFVETGLRVDAYCGGEPAGMNRALLWQKGHRSFILFAQLDANDGRGFVTESEMRRVAEGLNTVESADREVATLDPERLLSRKDAEKASGMEIRLPSRMLTGMLFDHISLKAKTRFDYMIISTQYLGKPVGDGRFYFVNIFQIPESLDSLENLELAGGFSPVSVKGNPGIYQAQCWDATVLANGLECHQILTWFDGDTQFDIFTYFPAEIPKEVILSIAESME
jgi:hypothetical protein